MGFPAEYEEALESYYKRLAKEAAVVDEVPQPGSPPAAPPKSTEPPKAKKD